MLPTDKGEAGCTIPVIWRAPSFSCAHHIRQPNAELLVHHHDLTARDADSVHQHIERLAGQAIELDDRARRQLQQIAHGHAGPPHLQRQRDRDVEDEIQIHFLAAAAAGVGAQVAELRSCDCGIFRIGRAHVEPPGRILIALRP
jgi:hypothetical protein